MSDFSSDCGMKKCEGKIWETRMAGESPAAFNAFNLYRSMGWNRSIKGCLALHEIEEKKYANWNRWRKLFNWDERASKYDEYVAQETERQIIAQRVEQKEMQIAMLSKFNSLVERRLDTLKPDDLNVQTAMDILERSSKLGDSISGKDRNEKQNISGQLEINFVDDFKGV